MMFAGERPANFDIASAEEQFCIGYDGWEKDASVPEQFTVVYLSEYAESWAPNGETE